VRILVVGGGGREHALAWACRRDCPECALFCLPGNAGTARIATNLPGSATDVAGVVRAAREQRIDLVIVGPEGPLAAGLVDALAEAGIPVFGPTAAAARIESSKAFAKDLMVRQGVPTARSRTFSELEAAERYIETHPEPLVVKASGLAGGKGAIVCATRTEALAAARAMLAENALGKAGSEVLVEEFLDGEELSVLAITDGEHFAILPPAQDHKRLQDGDFGPNTGGMGAYCPVSVATPALLRRVAAEIIAPTLRALKAEGAPYRGVLYAGLMIRPDGSPAVIEFNSRFGDPEAQAILTAMPSGVLQVLRLIAEGGWMPSGTAIGDARHATVTTVLAAEGYPDAPVVGAEISIPADLEAAGDVLLFHAGTAQDPDGRLRVAGGRVLGVTAVAPTIAEAAQRSRVAAESIHFEGKQFRRDIGWRELARNR
jgi:phosphoribosylamine--glycine ligase